MNPIDTPPKEIEGRISHGTDWREIVSLVGDLPPISHVAAQAIKIVEDPNSSAEDLSKVISMDPALAARVLKIANSAMFSRQREISTINQAVMIIGFKALKGIAIAATLRQISTEAGEMQKVVWTNSICCAFSASTIARKLRKPFLDEIFLLGLLHNLGQIVLLSNKASQQKYQEVFQRIRENHDDYVTAEQNVLGYSHALIGALVAKKWNFSDETCQVILHYKDPIEDGPIQGPLEEKTALIQLGEMIAHVAADGSPEGYPNQMALIRDLSVRLGFNKDSVDADLEELIDKVRLQYGKEAKAYD